MQYECAKIRNRITPNTENFHAVFLLYFLMKLMKLIFANNARFFISKVFIINSLRIVKIWENFKEHDICSSGAKHKYWKKVSAVYSSGQKKMHTLEFRIDATPRLLIVPFFATLPNLIQRSPFINFGEFCEPSLLFQRPRLLIHVHSRQQ